MSDQRARGNNHIQRLPRWNPAISTRENLLADRRDTARYCGLQNHDLVAYPRWGQIPSKVYRRMIVASVVALLLQWGTTGASILIAFLTPTVGLGCRSGSCMYCPARKMSKIYANTVHLDILYGSCGTLVWACLVLSMLISHEVMLQYQEKHTGNTTTNSVHPQGPQNPDMHRRTLSHKLLCATAVTLRYVGKSLAVLNTLWLIASSLMEFTGGFDNCWCKGIYVSLGKKGWVVLFRSAEDLANTARLPWGGGLAVSLIVCIASYTFFYFGAR